MAIDFIIGALLLLSASVNVLALGSFWVTPSLRTTANRFVINLLIVNLVSCIILAPSLLLNSNVIRSLYVTKSVDSQFEVGQPMRIFNKTLTIITNTGDVETIVDIYGTDQDAADQEYESSSRDVERRVEEEILDITCSNNSCKTPTVVFRSKASDAVTEKRPDLQIHEIRSWVLDVAAAIGALSVVLVVGDTWCAVTDPLRYHSRVSGLRAWILIGSMWIFGIIFGIASSFRTTQDDPGQDLPSSQSSWDDSSSDLNSHALYNTVFSCTYFICIILLPFGLVCAMYWRIFSEARENGLRMRQNGSSPLLQSALNLVAQNSNCCQGSKKDASEASANGCRSFTHSSVAATAPADLLKTSSTPPQPAGGLTLKIDNETRHPKTAISSDDLVKEIFHQSVLTPNHIMEEVVEEGDSLSPIKSTCHMRRNQSARQLFLFGVGDDEEDEELMAVAGEGQVVASTTKSDTLINRSISNPTEYLLARSRNLNNEMRHVHSTPDLHKFNQIAAEKAAVVAGNLNQIPVVTPCAAQVPPKALSYMTSIRHRLSNASSLFKYREESRAARISILVVIMFLISYIPFGLLVLTEGHNTLLSNYSQTVMAILTVVLANISSPFIFAYRNKRVRRGVKRLIGLEARQSDKLNRRQNMSNYTNNLTIRQPSTKVTKIIKLHSNSGSGSSIRIKSQSIKKGSTTTPSSTPNSTETNGGLPGNCGNTFILEIEKCSNGSLIDEHDNALFEATHNKTNVSYFLHRPSLTGATNNNNHNHHQHLHLHPSSFAGHHQYSRTHRNSSSVSSNTIRCDESALIKEKKSIFKRVCDTSRKLGCGSASCTTNEQTVDV